MPGPKVVVTPRLPKPVSVSEVVLLIRISIGLDHKQSEDLYHLHLPRFFAYMRGFLANVSLRLYQPKFESHSSHIKQSNLPQLKYRRF